MINVNEDGPSLIIEGPQIDQMLMFSTHEKLII